MDNAFERARAAYGTGAYDDATLEFLFPQLKESEDERIRKALIDGVSQIRYKGDITREQMVAWLEKQKENPKLANSISSDCASSAKCEDRWYKVTDFLPDNGREVLAKDKLGNTLLAMYDGEGWDVSVYDDEDYRCHNGISKWCEIPSEKQKDHFRDDAKMVEQKPAEWSEEDKGILLSVKCVIDEVWHSKNNTTDYPANELEEMWNWLDTLWQRVEYPQPSWKPSEEQMNALQNAVALADGNKVLAGLYEHLKKLM